MPTSSAIRRARILAAAVLCAAVVAGLSPAPADAVARPTSPSAAASPSGTAAPRGDLPHWKQVIRQDFTKDAPLGSFARRYPGWAGYDGHTDTSREAGRPPGQRGVWTSRTTTSVHDGVLDCRLHTEGVTPQVCAVTPTKDGKWWKGRMYGRYVVRFRTDRIPAYKIAWLLWPQSDVWDEGEIDFPEGPLDGTITGAAHLLGDPEDTGLYFDSRTSTRAWHTAVIDWRPGRLTLRLDDRGWTTRDPAVLPVTPMRWVLQAESRIAAKAPPKRVEGSITIDWLTTYRWIG